MKFLICRNVHRQNCELCKTENLHLQNCAQCRKLHLQKSVQCRFAHFVHDGFSHICRFAHLCFSHLQKSFVHVQKFASMITHVNIFFVNVNSCSKCFFHIFQRILTFLSKSSKCRKSRKNRKCPENVRKKLTCS